MAPRVRRAAAAPTAIKAAAVKPAAKSAPTARQALKEKTNTTRTAATAAERRDASGDAFVKDSQRVRRGARRAAQGDDDLLMAGGLGPADALTSMQEPLSGQTSRRSAAAAAAKGAPGPKPAVDDTAALDASADGLLPSLTPSPPARALRTSLGTRPPSSVLRGALGTPGAAVDQSVLALRKFRRRPRQPSMLQMVQQRRASVQASGLGESLLGGYDNDVDLDADLEARLEADVEGAAEAEDDFNPDAEGTPLLVGRSRAVLQPAVTGVESSAAARSSRKRTSEQAQLISPTQALDSSKSRRTAALSNRHGAAGVGLDMTDYDHAGNAPEARVYVHDSPPPAASPAARRTRRNGGDGDDLEVSIPSTDREIDVALRDQAKDISDADSVMAEPVSSSPAPPAGTQGTDIMADPQSQYSPRPTRARRTDKLAKPISTSTLQSLLPKRRQTRRPLRSWTEYEIESSDSANGTNARAGSADAETTSRPRRRGAKAGLPRGKKGGSARKTSVAGAHVWSAVKPGAKAVRRTYGRGVTSDKENEGASEGEGADDDAASLADGPSLLPDDSLTMDEAAALSTELAAARAKFAAVDDWEMEFESVSAGEGSSQTWR